MELEPVGAIDHGAILRPEPSSVDLDPSRVRAGEVFIPFHFDEWCANRLTRAEFDPISREPNYKQCAVRVERSHAFTRRQQTRNTAV